MMSPSKFSNEKKSSVKVQLSKDWDKLMSKTNVNFFDSNKLYLKSVDEYKMVHNVYG